jgi:hypothetical protein
LSQVFMATPDEAPPNWSGEIRADARTDLALP